jgi:WD40 repeat protein
MTDCWYFSEGSKGYGPFSSAQIDSLHAVGLLRSKDLIWKEGDSESLHVENVIQGLGIAESAENRSVVGRRIVSVAVAALLGLLLTGSFIVVLLRPSDSRWSSAETKPSSVEQSNSDLKDEGKPSAIAVDSRGEHGPEPTINGSPTRSTTVSSAPDILDPPSKDLRTTIGEVRRYQGHKAAVTCVAFSSDGQIMATGSDDKSMRLWHVATGDQLHSFNDFSSGLLALVFTSDGSTVFACDHSHVTKFDVTRRTKQDSFDIEPSTRAVFSKHAHFLATNEKGVISIYDVRARTLRQSRKAYNRCLAFSPDEETVVFGASTLSCLDVASGQPTKDIVRQKCDVLSADLSPNGEMIVTGSYKLVGGASGNLPGDNAVRLWNRRTGEQIAELRGHKDWLQSVAFSPNGLRVISGGGGTPASYYKGVGEWPGIDAVIRLWDVKAKTLLCELKGHGEPVVTLQFSPDGKFVLSGSVDRTARLWRLPDNSVKP